MFSLYASITPYAIHRLPVEGGKQELYVEECGNPAGIPILVVHGGPGAGLHAGHRRFFDPDCYRVILFDQRGCGQSTPQGELESNTTQDLIADMEAIRYFLDIPKWALFGGSWGSTLSLLYAQAYPHAVSYLILRSIFLARKTDRDWFLQYGANQIFPLAWAEFAKLIPPEEQHDMLGAYCKLFHDPNDLTRAHAAKSWSEWNRRCSSFHPRSPETQPLSISTKLRLAQLEGHYAINGYFIEENQILNQMDSIKKIPGVIIHGQYDFVCPLKSAIELNNAWPASRLEIIPASGHASSDPGLTDALVRATRQYAKTEKTIC